MMTDKLIEMAVKAGFRPVRLFAKDTPTFECERKQLEAFANLIRADEREQLKPFNWTEKMSYAWHRAIPDVQKAFDDLMKARGE
jgi:hypothetical protein